MSGHHLKKRKDKKLADPKQNGGEQHKCNPGGNTHVRGNVEVDFPPSLKEQHNREQEKHNSREKVRQIVEALTLIGVFAAAGFSYWQGHQSKRLADVASNTYITANRPYVGISEVQKTPEVPPEFAQAEPKIQLLNADALLITALIKNFGNIPAEKFSAGGRLFLNHIEIPRIRIPDKPQTLYPSEAVSLSGIIRGKANVRDVLTGNQPLEMEVTIIYSGPGPGQDYRQCEKLQYNPSAQNFTRQGPLCEHPGTR